MEMLMYSFVVLTGPFFILKLSLQVLQFLRANAILSSLLTILHILVYYSI